MASTVLHTQPFLWYSTYIEGYYSTCLMTVMTMTKRNYVKRQRAVPMRVLNLGLGRTGTHSFREAMKSLGYSDCYHGYVAVFESPEDCEMWYDALLAKYENRGKPYSREEFDHLLGHCQAVCGLPAVCFAEELIAAYPEAKVILSLRDVDSWHMYVLIYYLINPCLPMIEMILQIRHRHVRLAYAKIGQHFFRGSLRRFGKDVFIEHYARISELVPADNLLQYHISEGWAPLCQFLGEPVPTRTFPSGNEVAGFRQKFQIRDRTILLEIVSKLIVLSVATSSSAY
ncbi:uncharacterized protein BDR25DRAFT_369212 [Lindgomyces ingoldianus]|uniref:Uncharacterized protein n=1 Tax=Lindgomyces ingoldianus TaxID=673940 RepID=A0ACB6QV83_9PLEO|nr:uncharacterized protein BDR25DRAFT_369212 [Lindgomyces ingoldianus]KAF2470756.1 hypothetical protein BDR25DRAFT_369212 [Lindgomyces ingoldianus]